MNVTMEPYTISHTVAEVVEYSTKGSAKRTSAIPQTKQKTPKVVSTPSPRR